MRRLLAAASIAGGAAGLYAVVVHGALTLDLGIGRTVLPLGPLTRRIAAPQDVVFDVIAAPYLGRTPRALEAKLRVWERGSDMVLAAHLTKVRSLTATTLETVCFQRPDRVGFRLVRGPVPHLSESFVLRKTDDGTELTWEGELGADFWAVGRWWGGRVARAWAHAVHASFESIAAEAERRAARGRGRNG